MTFLPTKNIQFMFDFQDVSDKVTNNFIKVTVIILSQKGIGHQRTALILIV